MGKLAKKGYNWKSRQVKNTIIDDSNTKNIQLDIKVEGHYDQSNELVLPSKKRPTKIKQDHTKITKILSKKHRKRLEKIVEKKKKKENRASLLEALSQVQAPPEELQQLTSIASIQTKGLKRYFREELQGENSDAVTKKKPKSVTPIKLNSLSGARNTKTMPELTKPEVHDPNIVGFDQSSSEDDEPEIDEPIDSNIDKKIENIMDTKIDETIDAKIDTTIDTPKKPEKSRKKSKPSVYVDVIRSDEIQNQRLKLPILAEEQSIMETLNENAVTIVAGETGSGKTTQIPQFLYEAGYALKKQIAVTEPRRVAAISMSQRIAHEMNLGHREISYLIRFEGNVTPETRIKFMTDGVLLKEVQHDFLLSNYSVVILDEAHERSVYTDILIGLLSRIVPLREKRGDPLKLIIMSATLRLDDFVSNRRLFRKQPPVISIATRQYPVTTHFNKRTNQDYIGDCFAKITKIQTRLPEGGILVFVTGQQEVNQLVKRLRHTFPYRKQTIHGNGKKRKQLTVPSINLDDFPLIDDRESDCDVTDDDYDDALEEGVVYNDEPMWVLPLYSLLPTDKQKRVFDPPPPDCRLCIVSTNVAETSLTIPGIKYVVDTGKTKVRLYDKVTGVTTYQVTWTSKASANQRAGRAGRTSPGHCYRLYSSAIFNDVFPDFAPPEIQQKPVDDLYLQMKCMNIDKVVNFPFPTAPDLLQLRSAERRLEILGLLTGDNCVTKLGRAVAKFPVLPRFGKMLALSHQHALLPYTITLVAALSVQEILLETPINTSDVNVKNRWRALRRQWAGSGQSYQLGDNMVLLKAVGAAEFANVTHKLEKFCHDNGLRHKALLEIRKLRHQLTNEINANVTGDDVAIVDPKLPPPTDIQAKLLRQILLSGLGDQVARKVPQDEIPLDLRKHKNRPYQLHNMEEFVYLHSSAILNKDAPDWVIYNELYESGDRILLRGVTAIDPAWLPIYVPLLCNLSAPLTDPEPNFRDGKVYCDVTGTFGEQAWSLGQVVIEYPDNLDKYKWFARFLLEGKVFPRLEKFKTSLLSQPSIMCKSWAKLQTRTESILKALAVKKLGSKQLLENHWKSEPKYLLREYLQWLPQSAHSEATLSWPPV